MNLLVYTTASRWTVERLEASLAPFVPDGALKIHRSIGDFSHKLRQPKDDMTIAVLLLARPEDLLDVLAIRHLFGGIRLILVLPDTEEDTIAMAHRLRPRYLTYIDGNFLGLSSVVNKMVERYLED
jgi:hypothetical protein